MGPLWYGWVATWVLRYISHGTILILTPLDEKMLKHAAIGNRC